MLVFNLTDQVRETIQQTLYRLLLRRRSAFGGLLGGHPAQEPPAGGAGQGH